jgi:hypothetical protein
MNHNEIVARITNMLLMYEEPKYENTMPFSLLALSIKLSASADELRGDQLSPNVVKNK